jgi:hypothetical protein
LKGVADGLVQGSVVGVLLGVVVDVKLGLRENSCLAFRLGSNLAQLWVCCLAWPMDLNVAWDKACWVGLLMGSYVSLMYNAYCCALLMISILASKRFIFWARLLVSYKKDFSVAWPEDTMMAWKKTLR